MAAAARDHPADSRLCRLVLASHRVSCAPCGGSFAAQLPRLGARARSMVTKGVLRNTWCKRLVRVADDVDDIAAAIITRAKAMSATDVPKPIKQRALGTSLAR